MTAQCNQRNQCNQCEQHNRDQRNQCIQRIWSTLILYLLVFAVKNNSIFLVWLIYDAPKIQDTDSRRGQNPSGVIYITVDAFSALGEVSGVRKSRF